MYRLRNVNFKKHQLGRITLQREQNWVVDTAYTNIHMYSVEQKFNTDKKWNMLWFFSFSIPY